MLCKEKLEVTYYKLFTRKVFKGNMCCDGTANIPSALQVGLYDILNVAFVQSLTVWLKSPFTVCRITENIIIIECKYAK